MARASALTPALRRTLVVALLVFLADRALKVWVVEILDLRGRFVLEVWDPFLMLTMAWNQGVNFGLLNFGEAGRWLLVALSVAISLAVLWWVRRARSPWPALGAGLLVGGALGNAWDRAQWGAVADFLNMSCCGIHNPFAFNLADVAIFAGAFLLIVLPDSAPRPRRRKKA
ncbi:signal peptidase II [soil metagenome]